MIVKSYSLHIEVFCVIQKNVNTQQQQKTNHISNDFIEFSSHKRNAEEKNLNIKRVGVWFEENGTK